MFEPLPESRMRRRIYLMRHGEVAYFDHRGDPVDSDAPPLTEDGQFQARAAGVFLRDVPFDLAFHTGLKRTIQTAHGALLPQAIDAQPLPDLREIKGGDMTGMSKEEIKREFIHVFKRAGEPGLRYARGELIADFEARVTTAFRDILLTPDWTNLLIVAHSVTNAVILSGILGAGIGGVGALDQDPGCINIIDADVDVSSGAAELKNCFVKALNITPVNLNKFGYNLKSNERLFVHRKKLMAEAAAKGEK